MWCCTTQGLNLLAQMMKLSLSMMPGRLCATTGNYAAMSTAISQERTSLQRIMFQMTDLKIVRRFEYFRYLILVLSSMINEVGISEVSHRRHPTTLRKHCFS